jgi:hypothetical protein
MIKIKFLFASFSTTLEDARMETTVTIAMWMRVKRRMRNVHIMREGFAKTEISANMLILQ